LAAGNGFQKVGAMKKTAACVVAACVALLVVHVNARTRAGQGATTDVSGAWIFTVESAAGTSNPTVTFKQEGEKLTGQYSSPLVGEANLTGTVKGRTIEFAVTAIVQGVTLQLTYSGTVDGTDTMRGKLSAGEFGDGTFTARRK
jgi:hypothetical protein